MASASEDARQMAVEEDGPCPHRAANSAASFGGLAAFISEHISGSREVKAGNDIYSIGDRCRAVHIVMDGWVALYDLLHDGRRQILQFVLPGALLGFDSDPGAVATYGAEALTDTVVGTISYAALALLARAHPEIGMQFAELIARDRNLSFDHLTSIGRRCARERVARLLLELFIRCSAQWPGHRAVEMQLPLTQEHIADATGLTNIHVNRVLSELRDEGIAQFHYRKLVILDPERLLEVAAIDPHLARTWMARSAVGEKRPEAVRVEARRRYRSPPADRIDLNQGVSNMVAGTTSGADDK